MKKTIPVLLIFLLFSSCKTKTFFHYSTKLSKVEIENESKSISSTNSYTDDIISISWYMMREGFEFSLNNNTKHAIVLDWNSASYINEKGYASKLIHDDRRYFHNAEYQEPTIVPPGASVFDVIMPLENMMYSPYPVYDNNSSYHSKTGYGEERYHNRGWRVTDLFPYYTKDIYERNIWLNTYLGKDVSIYLPISVNEVWYNYKFTFTINEITIQQKRPQGILVITDREDIPKDKL